MEFSPLSFPDPYQYENWFCHFYQLLIETILEAFNNLAEM